MAKILLWRFANLKNIFRRNPFLEIAKPGKIATPQPANVNLKQSLAAKLTQTARLVRPATPKRVNAWSPTRAANQIANVKLMKPATKLRANAYPSKTLAKRMMTAQAMLTNLSVTPKPNAASSVLRTMIVSKMSSVLASAASKNPKAAPKVIIKYQIPTRAVPPTTPLCSSEKKKYTRQHKTPTTSRICATLAHIEVHTYMKGDEPLEPST